MTDNLAAGADSFATGAVIEPSQDNPGWHTFDFRAASQYNWEVIGPVIVRVEDERTARVRFQPKPHMTNAFDQLHGGGVLGMIDVALFGAVRFIARHTSGAITLDLNTQFIGAGQNETQTDAVVEVLRETRNLVFLRGTVVQGDNLVAAFSGTVRKINLDKAR